MIYADYNGSAPLSDDVKEYLLNRFENNGPYANPNAIPRQLDSYQFKVGKS